VISPSILIVDDEKTIRENLAKYLSREYTVYSASNGQEAIKLIEENSTIGVVLSDMKMPDMDGIELLETIQGFNKDIVVIFITGFYPAESEVDLRGKGIYAYLTKPIDLDELNVTLKNAIEHKKMLPESDAKTAD
jgi:DNA-binding NtrC family response regulator